jgi:hypothetical protein
MEADATVEKAATLRREEETMSDLILNLFSLLAGGFWLWLCKRKRRGATVNWIQYFQQTRKTVRAQDVREIWRSR